MIDRHVEVRGKRHYLGAGEFTGQVIDRHISELPLTGSSRPAGEFTGQVIDRHPPGKAACRLKRAPANSPAK